MSLLPRPSVPLPNEIKLQLLEHAAENGLANFYALGDVDDDFKVLLTSYEQRILLRILKVYLGEPEEDLFIQILCAARIIKAYDILTCGPTAMENFYWAAKIVNEAHLQLAIPGQVGILDRRTVELAIKICTFDACHQSGNMQCSDNCTLLSKAYTFVSFCVFSPHMEEIDSRKERQRRANKQAFVEDVSSLFGNPLRCKSLDYYRIVEAFMEHSNAEANSKFMAHKNTEVGQFRWMDMCVNDNWNCWFGPMKVRHALNALTWKDQETIDSLIEHFMIFAHDEEDSD